MSSWPIFKVNGSGIERLKSVLNVMSEDAKYPIKFVGFVIEKGQFVLFEYKHYKMIPFPVALDHIAVAEIAQKWIEEVEFPRQPDHDGDNKKGWLVSRDSWGHVDGYGWESVCKIEPHWIMYGK